MTDASLVDAPPDAALSGRRATVLAHLRDVEGPLSVAEVAARTGLHVNTARFHLDGLVDDGLAERSIQKRDVPGRPRILYRVRDNARGPRSYRLLAEMLTGMVSSLGDPRPAALEAGRAWGRHLVERPAPSQRLDRTESLARLNRVLDSIGFQSEVHTGEGGTEIRLLHCPFREVAERHADVVCALHLGLMEGALSELNTDLRAESLDPFVTNTCCLARVGEGQ